MSTVGALVICILLLLPLWFFLWSNRLKSLPSLSPNFNGSVCVVGDFMPLLSNSWNRPEMEHSDTLESIFNGLLDVILLYIKRDKGSGKEKRHLHEHFIPALSHLSLSSVTF